MVDKIRILQIKLADAESEEYAYKNLKNVLTTNISKAYLNSKLNEEK